VIFLVSSCAAPRTTRRSTGASRAVPDIRVLLDEGRERSRINADDGVTITAGGGITLLETSEKCAVVVSGRYPQIELRLEPDGRVATAEGDVWVVPNGRSALSYDGKSYAGGMQFWFGDDGKITVVNIVPLETYLEGVLPHEMGNPGPDGFDAMKSQAIAARTYALGRISTRESEPFDVYAGVRDQVYGGLKDRHKYASSAVSDTRGLVLDYDGEMVKAYYCACCGGHTSDITQVWPHREPADYLFGIPDREAGSKRSFCRDNRYFRWRYSYTGSELGDVLRKTLPKTLGVSATDVGAVKDLRVVKRSHSGRVIELSIITTKNEFTVSGDQIRWVLLADPKENRILPSLMFKLERIMERDRVAFVSIMGGGNGHGVGMCQNGAIAMAKKGYTYKMILEHYYPGCEVVKTY
jgi:stage II sporulation protein D